MQETIFCMQILFSSFVIFWIFVQLHELLYFNKVCLAGMPFQILASYRKKKVFLLLAAFSAPWYVWNFFNL